MTTFRRITLAALVLMSAAFVGAPLFATSVPARRRGERPARQSASQT